MFSAVGAPPTVVPDQPTWPYSSGEARGERDRNMRERRPATGGAAGRRRAVAALLVLAAPVLALAIGLVDDSAIALWAHAGVVTVSAFIVLGVAPRRGRSAPAWALLGLGLLIVAGALLGAASSYGDDPSLAPVPNFTDFPSLAGLAMIGAAVLLMAFSRAGRVDWIARIDASIVAVGVGVVLAEFLWPKMVDADLTGGGVAMVALALGVLTGLIATGVRLALTGASRLPSGRFLVEGVLATAAAVVVFRASQLQFTDVDLGHLAASLGVVGPLLFAGAAVHPSAARVVDGEHQPAHELSPLRLVLLVAAAGAGPATAVVQQLLGDAVDGVVLGVTTTLLVVLLAARLQLVVRAGQVQAGRERTIREAAMAFGGVRDLPSIRSVALKAAAQLVAGDIRYVAWVVINDRGAVSPLELVGPAGHLDRAYRRHRRRPRPAVEPRRGRRPRAGQHRRRGRGGADPEPARCSGGHRRGGGSAGALRGRREPGDPRNAVRAGPRRARSRARSCTRSAARLGSASSCGTAATPCSSSGRDGRIRYQSPSVVRVLGFLTVDLDGATVAADRRTRRSCTTYGASSSSSPHGPPSPCGPSRRSSCAPTTPSSTPRSSV